MSLANFLSPASGGGSSYDPANVAITGGTINGVTIGGVTPGAGTFTTLSTTGVFTVPNSQQIQFGGGDGGVISPNQMTVRAGWVLAWAQSGNTFDTIDTTLRRSSAGIVGIDTDASGTPPIQLNGSTGAITAGAALLAGNLTFATDNAFDIGASGANRPRNVFVAGNIVAGSSGNIQTGAGAGNGFKFNSRGEIAAINDGIFILLDSSTVDFNRLQFGGTTSSFPALKRSSATLQVRLADDSAFTNVQGKLTTEANAVTGLVAGALAALTTATVVIYDATGTAYRVPCLTP